MGDYPVPELGDKTPLQAAHIPNMRRMAAVGEVRMVQTVPDGMAPGSDVANLAMLGYDAAENYTGRAPIEAAGAGIPMEPADVAFRCNLVTVQDGIMKDHSADHISDEEASVLIADLAKEINREGCVLHQGVSYRHLLIWRDGPEQAKTEPPHEHLDEPVAQFLPSGNGAEQLNDIINVSKKVFVDHPVNQARVEKGLNPATQVWLWGQGKSMQLETFKTLYGLSGGMITAVDLLRGLGKLSGLEVVDVEGATGFIDTNYAGKVEAALRVLEKQDFVFVHVEAPDECGHQGDAKLKTKAIEDFDEQVVGPIWRALEERGEPYCAFAAMDHRTPVELRGHTSESVPMVLVKGPLGGMPSRESSFDEYYNDGVSQGLARQWIEETLQA